MKIGQAMSLLDIKEVAEQVAAWINDNQINFKIIEHDSDLK